VAAGKPADANLLAAYMAYIGVGGAAMAGWAPTAAARHSLLQVLCCRTLPRFFGTYACACHVVVVHTDLLWMPFALVRCFPTGYNSIGCAGCLLPGPCLHALVQSD